MIGLRGEGCAGWAIGRWLRIGLLCVDRRVDLGRLWRGLLHTVKDEMATESRRRGHLHGLDDEVLAHRRALGQEAAKDGAKVAEHDETTQDGVLLRSV